MSPSTPACTSCPRFASVLVPGGLLQDCGWDAARVEHHAESLTLERPLEEAGSLLVDSAVVAVADQGAETGALIVVESRARRARMISRCSALRRSFLARGDGGFGGPRGAAGVAAHRMPERAPDLSTVLATRADQALLYRLCGDRDPGLRQSGSTRPASTLHLRHRLPCRAGRDLRVRPHPDRLIRGQLRRPGHARRKPAGRAVAGRQRGLVSASASRSAMRSCSITAAACWQAEVASFG